MSRVLRKLFAFFLHSSKHLQASPSSPEGEKELVLSAGDPRLPQHIAVIMDGNGRWASQRGRPRTEGHRVGASHLKRFVRSCCQLGIRYVTVYAFSTENWKRPQAEVEALMHLFVEFFEIYDAELAEQNIRLRFLGDLAALPQEVRQTIARAECSSKERTGTQLILAFNYGGRREILQAAQKWMQNQLLQDGEERSPSSLGLEEEKEFASYLYLPDLPDPDLVIRTGGEFRVSNFLLWQAAYSEWYVTDRLWPDFDEAALQSALRNYMARQRRFGGLQS